MKFTDRRLLYLLVPLVGLFIVGAVIWSIPSKPAKIVVRLDPPNTEEITSAGTIRTVKNPNNPALTLERHIPYADGSVGHQYFRDDGTLEKTTEDYPTKVGVPAQVKAKGTYSQDGKALLTGEVFRPDGSLWFSVTNTPDGSREDTFYFPNGWKFSSTVKKPTDEQFVTTYFHKSGNVWAKQTFEKTPYNSFNEKGLEVFDASSKKLVYKIEPVGYNDVIDGIKVNNYGRLITYFDHEGKRSHRQFSNTWYNYFLQTQGNLIWMQVFDTKTDTVAKTVEVEDANETMKLKMVSLANGTKRVFRNYGVNMRKVSLEKVDVQGQVKERFFEFGTLAYEIDDKGEATTHEDDEKVFETVDVLHLSRPNEKDLREKRNQAQAEDRNVLGQRDDSDPCKWYHKQ